MAVSLNVNTDGDLLNQRQVFNIDGVVYIFRVYFNSRKFEGEVDGDGNWYISLYDVDDNPIITGLKALPSRNMFERASYPTLFSGAVYCVDTVGDTTDNLITLTNFGQGKRYQLWYFTQEEIAEASA